MPIKNPAQKKAARQKIPRQYCDFTYALSIFKKKNIGDLIKVIQYVINNMRACSDMCYEKAKEYKIQTIVKRRNEFFDLFIEENSLGYMQNEKKN